MRHTDKVVRIGHSLLSTAEIDEIDRRLDEFLLIQKPFLRRGYTLRQLAGDIHVSLHHLSAFINQYYGINYNDLINTYRIQHCISHLMKEEWLNSKIEAIAKQSGFNNRNSFTAAFKKVTGMNPSKYFANNYKC